MSFIFSQVNGSAMGEAAPEIGAGTFYGTAFQQGFYESMLNSLFRLSEYQQTLDEDPVWNPRLKKEDANHYAQQQGVKLRFDEDPTQDELSLLIRRQIEQRDRQQILEAGSSGADRTVGRVGTQFLGSVLNPLDLPLMFIPIVGSGAKAAQVEGRLGSILARGIVTEETLAARGIALKGYTAAFLEGAVGQAITEVPLFMANSQDQSEYTSADFFGNVLLGGGFGMGMHTLGLGLKSAFKTMRKLSPETRENMVTGAMGDFLRGESINPTRFVDLDDGVVNAEVIRNSPDATKVEAATEVVNEIHDLESRFSEFTPKEQERLAAILEHPFIKRFQEEVDAVLYHATSADPAKIRSEGTNKDLTYFSQGEAAWANEGDKVLEAQSNPFKDRLLPDPETTYQDGPLLKQIIDERGSWSLTDIVKSDIDIDKLMSEWESSFAQEFGDDFSGFDMVAAGKISPEELAEAGNKAVKSFQEKEKMAADNKQQKLREEVAAGQTIPEKDLNPHGEVPTDDEFKWIEEEIEFLTQDLNKQMDALEGNVQRTKNPEGFQTDFSAGEWMQYLPEKDATGSSADYVIGDFSSAMRAGLSPKTAEILDALIELDPDVANVRVYFDPDLRARDGAEGIYYGKTDKIALATYVSPQTVVHEAVHGSAVRRWRQDLADNGMKSIPVTRGKAYLTGLKHYAAKTENKGLSGLVDAYARAIDHYATEVDPGSNIKGLLNVDSEQFFNSELMEPHYGLLNFDEFIAEALSNRQFQAFLDAIPSGKGETLLQRVMEKFKEFFGLSQKPESTLLNDFFDSYVTMTRSSERAPDGFLTGLKRATADDVSQGMLAKSANCILNAQA